MHLFIVVTEQVTEAQCRAALDGERANVALARHCVSELGGVPSMLAPFDSTNRPEEKVPYCFVGTHHRKELNADVNACPVKFLAVVSYTAVGCSIARKRSDSIFRCPMWGVTICVDICWFSFAAALENKEHAEFFCPP